MVQEQSGSPPRQLSLQPSPPAHVSIIPVQFCDKGGLPISEVQLFVLAQLLVWVPPMQSDQFPHSQAGAQLDKIVTFNKTSLLSVSAPFSSSALNTTVSPPIQSFSGVIKTSPFDFIEILIW